MYVCECGCTLDESVGSTKTSHPLGTVSRDEYAFLVLNQNRTFHMNADDFPNCWESFVYEQMAFKYNLPC
jgi:hypothetical protein